MDDETAPRTSRDRWVRAVQREFIFRRAMLRFLRDPHACAEPSNPTLAQLVYGWDNAAYGADVEFLAACVEHALSARGPILECGSGLSTILAGAVAQRTGRAYWALEHNAAWAARVKICLDLYAPNVQLVGAPIEAYDVFDWYTPPLSEMPASFALVLCDGPPGETRGGRYGLLPVMRERFARGCIILLDDAGRQGERAVAARWGAELGTTHMMRGAVKPFAEFQLP